jgi:hypothetical protein
MSDEQIKPGGLISLRAGGLSGIFRVVLVRYGLAQAYIFPIDIGSFDGAEDGKVDRRRMKLSAKRPILLELTWLNRLSPTECSKAELGLPSWVDRPLESLTGKKRDTYGEIKARTELLTEPTTLMQLLTSPSYNKEIARMAEELEVHRTTIARDLARFFICDCDVHKASMFATLARRPANPQARRITHKLGRKRRLVSTGHLEDAEGINVSEVAKEQIRAFVLSFKDRSKRTSASMYREFAEKFVSKPAGCLDDGTIVYRPDPQLNITRGQFRYWLNQFESARQQTIATVGRRRYNKDLRVLTGTARDLIQHPGQCYIIDSTVGDIYLVSAVDRRLLVGRPTIYVVIDAFSSMILSVHIGLEAPCLEQAQKALFRAVSSKDLHLEALGMSSHLLPALAQGCKPTSIFADRGELLSDGARQMSERTFIALSLAAAYRAEWKSLVERYFGIQNEQVLHWTPGGVRQRARERGERDVRLDAKLTMNSLYRLLWTLAAEWNLTKDMSKHASTTMLRKNVKATPLGFWQYGLEDLHGSPRFPSREDAIRWMLPPLKAKVNRSGIEVLEGLRFTAPWMTEDDAFFAQTREGSGHIYLDPDRPMAAYMYDRCSDSLRAVELVDTRQYAESDLTIEDIRLVEDYNRLCRQEDEIDHAATVHTLRKMRSSEVNREVKLTKQAQENDARSKTQRVASIRKHRKIAIDTGDLPQSPVQTPQVAPASKTGPKSVRPAAHAAVDDAWARAMIFDL